MTSIPAAGGEPLVSCLVCTHDYAEFLPRALDSALAQEYPPGRIEIVVVDDGSTDATPDAVRPYLGRVRYVRKENGGLNTTINRALAEATGELIALLSGDDEWPPDRVRRQVDFLAARPEVGLVYGDLEVIDAEGRTLHPSFWAAEGVQPRRGRVLGELLRRNFVSGGGLMVRAALRARFVPIPPEIAWEDWWIAARVAEVAELDYCPEPVYRYRLHGRNMNLGVPPERRGPLLAAELPTRRFLLRNAIGAVSAADALEGCRLFEETLALSARTLAVAPAELVDVGAEDRVAAGTAAAAGLAAWLAGDEEDATRALVRAIACDPFDDVTRAHLAALLRGIRPAPARAPTRARAGQQPAVSIIVPVRDRLELTRQCLEAIRRTAAHVPHEVVVVDDGSTDATREHLAGEEARGTLRAVLNAANEGFGRSCNNGAAIARGEHVVFLNNDTIPLPGWLDALLAELEDDPTVGAVGSRLLYPGWQVQHAGVLFDERSRPYHVHRGAAHDDPAVLEACDVPAVTGACLALRAGELAELGGFSDAYRMYVEDVDLCLAVWCRGQRVRYRPDSVLVHLESASATDVAWRDARVLEGLAILHERWAGRLPAGIAARCGHVLGGVHGAASVRSVAGLAFADELLERPALLAAYGRAFRGADDVTLLIRAAGSVEPLAALVARLGLDGADGPDLLVVGPEAGAEEHLAASASFLLSARTHTGPLATLPRVDEATVAGLGLRAAS
jgi:GT2 family glycosyltransferase